MKKIDLCGIWLLEGNGLRAEGEIPGSVYSILLQNKLMEDPHYRINELDALALLDNEFAFTKRFVYKRDGEPVRLLLEGVDTLCDLYVNGHFLARVDNMHRTYEFDVSECMVDGENVIRAVFPPLDKYIKEKHAQKPIDGCSHPMRGYMHVRKAHYMLGWDWGPRTPDAGIWRPIYLLCGDTPRIEDVKISQRHGNGEVYVTVETFCDKACDVAITLTTPQGNQIEMQNGVACKIENPVLWWPNGLGEQPLYTLCVQAKANGELCDEKVKKIGLRTLELVKEKDEYGESFHHRVNGVDFFAVGADYIPEDTILARCTKARTKRLLSNCVYANFNAVRVWGGGYYPDDYFFEICDEFGLVVFFDLMFACTFYDFGEEFSRTTLMEIEQNVKRIRHHASLGLISGNNEIEERFVWYKDEQVKRDYVDFFEREIPALLNRVAPDIAYVPSSPSSFGGGIDPRNENYGDSHFWGVWHSNEPFCEYRKHYFRYLSEFGFQSFPCYKTVEAFTLPEDRNIFSRVMEMHQRNYGANGKILSYLAQTYLYPAKFETLLYASQLLQADAIRYGVEHLRRNRGRCMGTLYWQLNDVWPGASWSSIDYFGRFKALHYAAKRFYAPLMISCEETGEFTTRFDVTNERTMTYQTKAKLSVNNETRKVVNGVVRWQLKNASAHTLLEGEQALTLQPLSVETLPELDFHGTDVNENYLWYEYIVDGKVASYGSVLFTKPKYFHFQDPALTVVRKGQKIEVSAKAYARYVEIYSPNSDFILEDNFFDMNVGTREIEIISGEPATLCVRSVYDIR